MTVKTLTGFGLPPPALALGFGIALPELPALSERFEKPEIQL
jgi:hypothetical protein